MLKTKSKILVVGPCEAGKTWISNFLAEATESSGGQYHPTQGVRILEFELEGNTETGRQFKTEVELWDCSGDRRFESCWPAFWKDTTGILLVYNPDKPRQEKELEKWYLHFVVKQNFKDSQCVIFSHHKPKTDKVLQPPSSQRLSGVHCALTDLEEDPDSLRDEFNSFVVALVTNSLNKQDQEEEGIMEGRH